MKIQPGTPNEGKSESQIMLENDLPPHLKRYYAARPLFIFPPSPEEIAERDRLREVAFQATLHMVDNPRDDDAIASLGRAVRESQAYEQRLIDENIARHEAAQKQHEAAQAEIRAPISQ